MVEQAAETERPLPLNRPLAWIAAAFCAGVIAAAQGWFPGLSLPIFLLVSSVILAWAAPGSILARITGLLVASCCAGIILWNVHQRDIVDDLSPYVASHPRKDSFVVEGRVRLANLQVINPRYHDFWIDADTLIEGNSRLPIRGGATVRWSRPGCTVFAGERVRVSGRATASLGHVNPGVRSFEDYMHRQGINTSFRCAGKDDVQRVAPASWFSLSYWASRLRLAEEKDLEQAMPGSALPFIQAIWLGYGSTIASDEYQAYLASGTVHILSVSGIHMVITFAAASFFARLFFRNRRYRACFVLIAILTFTGISGIRPSALRSAIMIILYIMADFFDRERDATTALSMSALLLVGWNPETVFDVGFLLSFLSVASLLLFGDFFNNLLDFLPRLLRGAVSVTMAVQILPTPLAINVFHVFPLLAPVANLVIVPLSTIALWLACVTSLVAFVSSHAALLFGHALEPFVVLIPIYARWIKSAPFSHLSVSSPTAPALLAYYFAAGMFVAFLATKKRRYLAITAVLLACSLACWRPLQLPAEVVFLDVGHGDATFVRSPGGKTMLVDGGDANEFVDTGSRVILPFLWSNHVTRLNCVAVSHPDRDHIGGLLYLAATFPVDEVLLGPVESKTHLEEKLLQICADRGIPVVRVAQGDTLDAGGMTLTALHPPPNASTAETVNNNSLVLRLDWQQDRILLTGDIEARAETAVARTDCAAAVLKVPHHGSKTSSSKDFIEAVAPRICVVSTGGTSGHEPADEAILDRYRKAGASVWRTDIYGGITLTKQHGLLALTTSRPRPVDPAIPGRPAALSSAAVPQN